MEKNSIYKVRKACDKSDSSVEWSGWSPDNFNVKQNYLESRKTFLKLNNVQKKVLS